MKIRCIILEVFTGEYIIKSLHPVTGELSCTRANHLTDAEKAFVMASEFDGMRSDFRGVVVWC